MGDELFAQFSSAINDELAALDCGLRIDGTPPPKRGSMWLVGSSGERLGWLPDHTDATTIARFETILHSFAQYGLRL